MIGDDDMPAYPSEDPGDETRERVYARAAREVQDGRRGPTVRPALTVPYEIKDEATGHRLDVIQDNDPGLPPEPNLQEPDDAT